MGLLSSLAGIAAPIVGNIIAPGIGGAIGGALGGAISSSGQPKSTTSTTQQQLDPRIQSILFGDSASGNSGLLSQYQSLLNQPQSSNMSNYGTAAQNYLGTNGGADIDAIRNTALGLATPDSAPTVSGAQTGGVQAALPAYAVGNQLQAPAQNSLDLSGTFNTLLNGGNTSALMNSLQAGNALTNQQLQQNQTSLTDNFQKSILPSIRGGAIAAGQYGGSRQGIAEGNAISDLTKQLNDQNTQVSLANSANNASQLASAYENGQNRALSAAQGLSAQQYGAASQNANTLNQAEFMNVGNSYDVSKYNAGLAQQSNLANQSSTNQAGLANQGAQLTTNAQNNGAATSSAGLLGGLMSQAYGVGNAQDNYALTRAQGVNGLLAPYLSANSSSSTTTPLYSNTGSSVLGGALAGSQLSGLLGGLSGGTSSLYNTPSSLASYSPAATMPINTGLLSNFSF